jgi:hypothetical protein
MTKKYEVRYSFSIYVEAEDSQEAVNKANEMARNIEQYGPGCVNTMNEECCSSYGLTPIN